MSKESRIYLIGFMGSGKSSLGKELSAALKLNFIDLDAVIEEKTNEELHNFFKKSEKSFRALEAKTLRELTFNNTVYALGGGTPCFFDNMDFIKENGISVFLKVSEDKLYERLKKHRKIRPLLSEKDETELREYISELLSERKSFYDRADIIYDEEKMNISSLIDKIDKIDQFR
ncbi:MAG: AAA family ATPase [Chitinophagales bacterium]|nr:AAA family ATPase [Chitinophagales bacterium]